MFFEWIMEKFDETYGDSNNVSATANIFNDDNVDGGHGE